MKRIKLIMLALVAVCALSGTAASSSQAAICARVAEEGFGHWGDSKCTSLSGLKNWAKIKSVQLPALMGVIFCARTDVNAGNWLNEGCSNPGEGEFIKVNLGAGPAGRQVNGVKLNQGSRGIKLQSKGPLILKGEITATPENIKATITCLNSTADGTIDGQGPTKQGQGKGTVTYTQCSVVTEPEIKGCTVAEPIKTGQLKSHLALASVQETEQIVELFEPAPNPQLEQKGEKPPFVTIHLNSTCAAAAGFWPVRGSVVGQLAPQEAEAQEGSLYFPKEPILKILHEGQEVKVGLTFANNPATFTGFYGARLQSGEKFGVFMN